MGRYAKVENSGNQASWQAVGEELFPRGETMNRSKEWNAAWDGLNPTTNDGSPGHQINGIVQWIVTE